MLARTCLCLMMPIVLLPACSRSADRDSGSKAAADNEPKRVMAATPKEAVTQFMAAWKTDDVAAALALTPKEFREGMREWVLAAWGARKAQQAFNAALSQRFGKAEGFEYIYLPWNEVLEKLLPQWQFLSYEIGDAKVGLGTDAVVIVQFKVRALEGEGEESGSKRFLAIQEGADWKCLRADRAYLDLIDKDLRLRIAKEDLLRNQKVAQQAQSAFETLTKQIKDGEFQSWEKAMEAAGKAISPLLKE